MAERGGGVPSPQHRQQHNQQQQQNEDQVGQQPQHLHINWSNFKPEFSGKPDEDAEVHLLPTNDWMNTHCFANDVTVQGFCLTLLGEASLWYHSLEPINVDWPELQNLFRQKYSCEQLFYAWRSFSFDENMETIVSYIT